MSQDLVLALISLAGTFLGTLSGVMINGKLTTYRIEQLEKKVDKHNNLIERTFQLERENAVIIENVRNTGVRVDELEKSFRKAEKAKG